MSAKWKEITELDLPGVDTCAVDDAPYFLFYDPKFNKERPIIGYVYSVIDFDDGSVKYFFSTACSSGWSINPTHYMELPKIPTQDKNIVLKIDGIKVSLLMKKIMKKIKSALVRQAHMSHHMKAP